MAIINSGGFTIPMAQKFLKETLEQEKIPCFVDKLGRTWDLDAYSNMAIRTGSRQSRNAGMLTADDHDLYYVVPIGSTCPVCAVLEGRVYSKSGTNPNYPPLTELYGKIDEAGANDLTNSYLTIHPNCRHTLVKWNEDTKTEEEIKEMRDKSSFTKHPKNINPQTQKEMEEYRASQREKAKFRGMLNEYHEMQAQGIDVPKNFQTFINNKENDTEKYKEWKANLTANRILRSSQIKATENGEKNSDLQNGESRNIIIKRAKDEKIETIDVDYNNRVLSHEEIVSKVGGGDKTRGSCASVAYAYVANEAGYNVLDFRGGKSTSLFAEKNTSRILSKLNGVISWEETDINGVHAVKRLLQNMELNKEYLLSAGKHMAIIKRIYKATNI